MSGPVLITGAGGMVGGAVAAHLRARGAPVAVHAGRADGALDLPGVAGALVDRWAPRVVIHCAGLTYGLPEDLWRANVLAPMRLLDAVARHSPAARLVLVGSSAEYGLTGPGVYLAEDAPCRPDSEYGMSKLATTRLAALSPVATVV
ncbi:MAG: NAD-dependent epimerase/dehydratase family protein, partial [Miltoncostaeaceae bacterium]